MIEVSGKNGIKVVVIADSVCRTNGHRMLTFEFYFHRWILAEINTHRSIGKNLQSSRAIPMLRAIDLIKESPAYPVHWGKNQSGMQSKEELTGWRLAAAKFLWNFSMKTTLLTGRLVNKLGAHKQWASRLLEPFVMTKGVFSGTDWDNLLWLRNCSEAQPEFGVLADLIQRAKDKSVPVNLELGEWHLPYIISKRNEFGIMNYYDINGSGISLDLAQKISASCAAQVSYRRMNDTPEKALEIYDKLFSGSKLHLSPTEHQATPIGIMNLSEIGVTRLWPNGVTHMDRNYVLHSGNLTGWIQFRQTLPNNVYVNPPVDVANVYNSTE